MLFHCHRWREVGRAWTGKVVGFEANRISERAVERLLLGVTVIDLRCSCCGDRKSIELLGHHIQTPNEV